MKALVKGLGAILVCGAFFGMNFNTAEAAEVADLNTISVETQELARHYPPPPPPPPNYGDRWGHRKPHHGDRFGHRPPPPPPPRHGDRWGHRPPRHGW